MKDAESWNQDYGLHNCEQVIRQIQADAIRHASQEVAKLAAHLVGNQKVDGTRDPVIYDQGIGCELASKMLLELASLVDKTSPLL